MKKLSILIALVLCITIGGVYATWTYTQSTDVADLNPTVALSLTEATFAGTYGTYGVDTTGLTLAIDPAPGTTHTTSLQMSGKIVITFTPHVYASNEVKENGVITTYQFSLTNDNWVFDDGHDNLGARPIVVIDHVDKHNVTWSEPDENGVLKFEIPASELQNHFSLTEFTLDTKALYDSFENVLGNGQIKITVSDGQGTTVNN